MSEQPVNYNDPNYGKGFDEDDFSPLMRAARELADEFGDDISEWMV